MAAPEEILAFPMNLYLADVGTAFPNVDVDPGVGWEFLGVEGDANYDEEGVVVSFAEEVFDFKPSGRTMPSKRFRTGEDLTLKVNVVDWSPETVAKVMNDAAVTTGANSKSVSLYRGPSVASFALLARAKSSVDNDLNLQIKIPKTFVSVNGDSPFTRGKVSMLPVTIVTVVHDEEADAPILEIQTVDGS